MSPPLSLEKIETSKLDRLLFKLMGWNAKPPHARFLEAIGEGELSGAELATRVGVTHCYIYPIARRLVTFGLVSESKPKVRAKTVFRLTERGLALLERSKT
jgi:predicted transcriptional regulator